MGYFTNSLELGCDCLGEIRYLDVTVADADGTVRTIPNGICLHEEDDGILWKHTDPDGHVEVRRSRRFVVSSFVTVDNYEYGYYWYFCQDGSIEFEAKLTGIVLTLARRSGDEPPARAPRSRRACWRRTTSTSSARASTSTSTARRTPSSRWTPWRRRSGPDNPYGGAYVAQETPLDRESAAQRVVDPMRSRYWKVVNPGAAEPRRRAGGLQARPGPHRRSRSRSPRRRHRPPRGASCTTTCG